MSKAVGVSAKVEDAKSGMSGSFSASTSTSESEENFKGNSKGLVIATAYCQVYRVQQSWKSPCLSEGL